MPSARNAVTHGVHTSVVVLRDENDVECRRIEAEHRALWSPVGPVERLLVDETHRSDESQFLDHMHRDEVRFSRLIDRASKRLAFLKEKRAAEETQCLSRQRSAQVLKNEKQPEKAT